MNIDRIHDRPECIAPPARPGRAAAPLGLLTALVLSGLPATLLAQGPANECDAPVRCSSFAPLSEAATQIEVQDRPVLAAPQQYSLTLPFGLYNPSLLAIPLEDQVQVQPTDFPAFYLVIGNVNCAGTAIGAQVLLTAAHCVQDDVTTKQFVIVNGSRHRLFCDRHPAYKPQPPLARCGASKDGCEADIAACWIDGSASVSNVADVAPASNAAPSWPLYGPTPAAEVECSDAVSPTRVYLFQFGAPAGPTTPAPVWPPVFTAFTDDFGICPGDSGSAAYTRLIGGAVASVMSEKAGHKSGLSFQVSVSSKANSDFLVKFQDSRPPREATPATATEAARPARPAKAKTPIRWQFPP